jgi:hypothetical protein
MIFSSSSSLFSSGSSFFVEEPSLLNMIEANQIENRDEQKRSQQRHIFSRSAPDNI